MYRTSVSGSASSKLDMTFCNSHKLKRITLKDNVITISYLRYSLRTDIIDDLLRHSQIGRANVTQLHVVECEQSKIIRIFLLYYEIIIKTNNNSTIPSQRVDSAAMLQITNHGNCQPIDSTNLFAHSEYIQQGLSRMFSSPITSVDQWTAGTRSCPLRCQELKNENMYT